MRIVLRCAHGQAKEELEEHEGADGEVVVRIEECGGLGWAACLSTVAQSEFRRQGTRPGEEQPGGVKP